MEGYLRLSNQQLQQILDRGYTYVLYENNITQKVTKEDLVFDKKEIEDFVKNKNGENNG